MRKLLYILSILLLCVPAYAAPPTRSYTYTTGTTIESTQVTANEDNIYNYLQAGVDTIKDGTVANADIVPSAGIPVSKLDLSTIATDITFTGNNTFAGTTVADLGTVTTADINGGTLDGVQIGGTTSTGELIVNNSSDAADGLGSQGTSGQVLTSAGAGSNPTWSTPSTFTDRGDAAAYDLTEASMTLDANWHDWDLSSIVGADTKAVVLFVLMTDNSVGATLAFRENGNSNMINAPAVQTQVANVGVQEIVIVPVASQTIEYRATEALTSVDIVVVGSL